MKKTILTLIVVFLFQGQNQAQQLPANACGIVNVYDASGNRTKRVYFCNNGTSAYPARVSENRVEQSIINPVEIQQVDALYPNPNTGRFSVSFNKPLQNAVVSVNDANGKTIQKFKASGSKIDFNLAFVATGIYFIVISDSNNIITKKVLKQ